VSARGPHEGETRPEPEEVTVIARKLLPSLMIATLCLLAAAEQAEARKVYLNGVDLDSVELPAVLLKQCDVQVDAKGNIFITARGYKIQVDQPGGGGSSGPARPEPARPDPGTTGGGAASPPTVGAANEKYFLVSFFNKKGATQYDIEVFVNSQMIRRVRSYADQVSEDITQYIKRGQKNEVIFVARKNLGTEGRISQSEMDFFRVVIGSGFESKGEIVLRRSIVEMKRTAAESQVTFTEKAAMIFR